MSVPLDVLCAALTVLLASPHDAGRAARWTVWTAARRSAYPSSTTAEEA